LKIFQKTFSDERPDKMFTLEYKLAEANEEIEELRKELAWERESKFVL